MSRESNPMGKLWETVTEEGAIKNPWAWFSAFLLICAFLGLANTYNGAMGKRCDWRWAANFPFGLTRNAGCLINVTGNVLFGWTDAPARPRPATPVRPETPVEPE